jgi:hypothetical protein
MPTASAGSWDGLEVVLMMPAVLRILGVFITDPNFFHLWDPGGLNNNKKEEENKLVVLQYIFGSHWIQNLENPKMLRSAQKIQDPGLENLIPDPDQGVKKKLDPGSIALDARIFQIFMSLKFLLKQTSLRD